MKKRVKTISINKFIIVLLVFSFLIAIIKLCFVSLAKETDGVNLTEFVNNRNTEKEILKAERGKIYSQDGEVLSQSINSYTVVAFLEPSRTTDEENPRHVVDKELTAQKLSEILGMSEEYILLLLNKEAYQVELGPNGRGITEITKKEIEALGLPGIGFIESQKRYYPMSTFASYIIGFAQTDEVGNINGKMGIEQYYNEELEGVDGYTIYQKDAYGYSMPNTKTITVPSKTGSDIYLTIDSKIQLFVENAIKEIEAGGNLDWFVFEVMDAKTGAIVASSSYPNFNNNTLNITNYLDPLVSYAYEPGSTMKIFSFLAAMENGVYNGSSTYNSGTVKIDDSVISDSNNVGWGTITYDEGFAHSSNVAATNLAMAIGREKLYNFYSSLGFGKQTGITLPGEYSGTIDFTYRTEIATASFGQGITTTPIQNLQALTIIANDGIEVQPYIVEKIVNPETGEVTYQHERKELGRKASSENIAQIKKLMLDVVEKGYTDARYYKSDVVQIFGKTGTAEVVTGNGEYSTGTYDTTRSFVAIFPYEDPQYVIYISARRYTGAYKNVANAVKQVIEEIAKYKNINELAEEIDKTKIVTLDNYISSDLESVVEKLKLQKLNVIVLGTGKYIINQYPVKGTKVVAGSKIFLISNNNDYVMPDITGWSTTEVTTLFKLLKVKYSLDGTGKVVKYSIPAGSEINSDTYVEVTLR